MNTNEGNSQNDSTVHFQKEKSSRRRRKKETQIKTSGDPEKKNNEGQTHDRVSENIEYRGHIYTRHNYFEDKKRKIDFVLVSSVVKSNNELEMLVTYIFNLTLQGVEYEISPGKAREDLVFIKLHCPVPVLQHNANIYNIMFDCQNPRAMPTVEHAWFHWKIFNNITTQPNPLHRDYVRAISSLSPTKQRGITSWERSLIMEKILTKTKFGPLPKNTGIKNLRAANVLVDAFPMHDGPWEWRVHGPLTDRQLLSKYWASFSCIFKNQPIRLIYKYYGPEVAFYFAFVDYYTKMLAIPAFIGILCFIYNWLYCLYQDHDRITEVCSSTIVLCPHCYSPKQCDFSPVSDNCYAAHYNVLFDNVVSIGFAIFCSMWATIFLGLWLRREFVFKFHWNLLNTQLDMRQRIEFTHKAKYTRISSISGERVNYMPFHIKFFKYTLTVICLTLMLAIMFVCLGIVVYTSIYIRRLIKQSQFEELQKYNDLVAITINAIQSIIFIHLLTPQFLKITRFLTNEENPTSMLDFYNSCAYKFYILSFFNNYIPIFYVALIKGAIFTHPADLDNYKLFGWRTDVCTAVGCSFGLTIFLLYFLGSKLLIIQTFQLVKIYFKKLFAKRNLHQKKQSLPSWERNYTLKQCGELFLMTDFMNLVIQYGFVIFFIVGLPLSPLVAMISNIIQIRLDARRILRTYRRPVAKVLPGIGSWNSILRLVTFVGAMTNAAVIAFTSDLIDMEVYRLSHHSIRGFINSTFSTFAVKDYPTLFNSLLKENSPIISCVYKARRNPPQDEKKYEFSDEHWKLLCFKLGFMLIFQQMLWLLAAFCSNAINPVPDEVLEELTDEALKIRETRFETIEQNFYGPKVRYHQTPFEID